MWPRRVGWLNHETGVREARGRRVQNPETAAANAVAEHLPERFEEPVQTDPLRRGWRCDGGQRCRVVHALWKPDWRLIP